MSHTRSHPLAYLIELFETRTSRYYSILKKSIAYQLLGWESEYTQQARFKVFLELLEEHIPFYFLKKNVMPRTLHAKLGPHSDGMPDGTPDKVPDGTPDKVPDVLQALLPRYLDMGCGFAAFYDYMQKQGVQCDYTGVDAVDDHVSYCQHTYATQDRVRFFKGSFLETNTSPLWLQQGLQQGSQQGSQRGLQRESQSGLYDVAFISGALNVNIASETYKNANELLVSFIVTRLLHTTAPYLLVNFLHAHSNKKENFFAYHDPHHLSFVLETFGIEVLAMREHYLPNDFTLLLSSPVALNTAKLLRAFHNMQDVPSVDGINGTLSTIDSHHLRVTKPTSKTPKPTSEEVLGADDNYGVSSALHHDVQAERVLYTDGGCSGNPGPGAWAFVEANTGYHKTGSETHTTNNKMELCAVIAALRYVQNNVSKSTEKNIQQNEHKDLQYDGSDDATVLQSRKKTTVSEAQEQQMVQNTASPINQQAIQKKIIPPKEIPKKMAKKMARVIIVTDSQYVKQGMEVWIHTWKKNNWQKANGDAVLNKELWILLDALVQAQDVQWRWVKGHSGDIYNEQCHDLLQHEIRSQIKSQRRP